MMKQQNQIKFLQILNFITLLILPAIGLCSVESSLIAVQTKLIGTILPLAAILGLVFAGLSFVAGSPNARNHLILAMVGAAIGFGAPSIVSWIQSLIH
jgi:type IV secretory pathway VirB2 component (pilin)